MLLAAARLLENRDFTIHWEHAAVLKRLFRICNPRQARYVIDGNRITCGGGVAPLDMMHAMISERMGSHFARRVSDWYLHTDLGEPSAPQRRSAVERFGTHHPALLTVLEKMEATIEQPLDRATLAQLAGISPRHLDRLFADHMKSGLLRDLQGDTTAPCAAAFATEPPVDFRNCLCHRLFQRQPFLQGVEGNDWKTARCFSFEVSSEIKQYSCEGSIG